MKCKIRFGLCCIFREEPITFRQLTATALMRLPRPAQLRRIREVCCHNASALLQALKYCAAHGIGSFRVSSRILPLKTHPLAGYALTDLPKGVDVIAAFKACGRFARRAGIRTTFHPDQFIVLNSPRSDVVQAATRELLYQAEMASWIGADVINIHGGGAYGDKSGALERLIEAIRRLPPPVRRRLTLENDERVFTVRDLLPVCRATGTPLVYDVHHHRCNPDGLSVAAATRLALTTWNREPLFHVSGPRFGWGGRNSSYHSEHIDTADFPGAWCRLKITVEVEAKAKEKAVLRLMREFEHFDGHGCG